MINIYKVHLTVLQQEIMRFLFANAGKKLNARALSLSLDVSQPAISKALPLLGKEELILNSKDKFSGRLEIEMNRDNPIVIGMKRVENLRLLYESGLAKFLIEKFPGCTIIVFGSFSKGEDIYKSDIDIAVIGTKEREVDTSCFEKMLNKEISLHFFPSFREIVKELKNNIIGGVILHGWIDI